MGLRHSVEIAQVKDKSLQNSSGQSFHRSKEKQKIVAFPAAS